MEENTPIMRFVQLACVSMAALALTGAVSAQPRCNGGNANYNYNYNNGYNGYNANVYTPSQCGQPYFNANLPVGTVYNSGYNNGYANGYNNGNCNNNRNYSYNNNGRWNNNGNYWYGNNNNGRRHHRNNNNNGRCR